MVRILEVTAAAIWDRPTVKDQSNKSLSFALVSQFGIALFLPVGTRQRDDRQYKCGGRFLTARLSRWTPYGLIVYYRTSYNDKALASKKASTLILERFEPFYRILVPKFRLRGSADQPYEN